MTDTADLRRFLGGYLAGVFLTRIVWVALPLDVGPFAFTLSVLAFPVLFWTATERIANPHGFDERSHLAFAVAAGVVGDEAMYLALRAEGLTYWSQGSLLGSAVSIVAVGALAAVAYWSDGLVEAVSRRATTAVAGVVALSFVGFRASQEYLRASGVPNEERSFVLYGHELHHASTGTVMLLTGVGLLAVRGVDRRIRLLGTALLAVGLGFVADQYTYMFFATLDDAAYFTLASYLGGALATGSLILLVFYHVRMARRNGT
jgi:hypothetical protein